MKSQIMQIVQFQSESPSGIWLETKTMEFMNRFAYYVLNNDQINLKHTKTQPKIRNFIKIFFK